MDAARPVAFSVIIPTRDRPAQLQAGLECLRRQKAPTGGFEVVVVDDGSALAVTLPPMATNAPGIQLIRQANQGPAAARNAGARAARGTYLAFLDDDCQPESGWLMAFERALSLETEPVLLGGRTRNAASDNAAAEFNQRLCDSVVELTAKRGGFFPSNNLCVPRLAFERLEGFRAAFRTAGGEDRDFSHRWHAAGWRLRAVPDAEVRHIHRQTLQQFWRMHERYGRGARQLSLTHGGRGATMLNPFLLAARTLRKTGLRSAHLYVLSQVATAVGYLRQTVARDAQEPRR